MKENTIITGEELINNLTDLMVECSENFPRKDYTAMHSFLDDIITVVNNAIINHRFNNSEIATTLSKVMSNLNYVLTGLKKYGSNETTLEYRTINSFLDAISDYCTTNQLYYSL